MPYIVRRLQTMDLTFFAVHSANIPGRQRGINIDSWLVPFLPFAIPTTVRMRYRHVDTGLILEETRPVEKMQKNVRLHGRMVRGEGYLQYSRDDIMLLSFTERGVTWAVFRNQGDERPLFRFLSDARNVEYRRNMGIVRGTTRISALQALLSRYDPALFFTDEIEALESEPSSTTVRNYIRRRISPQAFENLQRAREANGRLGEEYVLNRERVRLTEAGHAELAEHIRHLSADDPTAPYDIRSYEAIGERPDQERFIEVKSTSGNSLEFEMSEGEWRFAEEHGDQHYIYRVTQVTSAEPRHVEIRNIVAEIRSGNAESRPSAFRIRLLRRPR